MRTFLVASLIAASQPAAADNWNADNTLPFAYEIVRAQEGERDGATFTVVTVRISNREAAVPSVDFLCEAHNNRGRSWDIIGRALNLSPREQRDIRLISRSPDTTGEFRDPSSINCRIQGFDGGLQ